MGEVKNPSRPLQKERPPMLSPRFSKSIIESDFSKMLNGKTKVDVVVI